MIFLSVFMFSILIIFTIRMSKKMMYKSTDPAYKEYFIWNNKSVPVPLLLHTITINDTSFSGYSKENQSIKSFELNPADRLFMENILASYKFSKEKCSNCHTSIQD